jgi:hypothetical protein
MTDIIESTTSFPLLQAAEQTNASRESHSIPPHTILSQGILPQAELDELNAQVEFWRTMDIPTTHFRVDEDGSISKISADIESNEDTAEALDNFRSGEDPEGVELEEATEEEVAQLEAAEPTVQYNNPLKIKRLNEFKRSLTNELQPLIKEASELRIKITEAKTKTKKDFYGKKFKKIQGDVLRYVATLQQIDALISADTEGTDDEQPTDTTE